ncbi:aspartate--ammonia ligase [Ureaplasma zalophigenitalium]|uniref:Aspartate--ammonia ligase n=1 Tax=Ureaplasma zalophigenitalium TaxID=907723 RepID=A0ABT3BQF0_9BACT|nr:aspartate--ammonia ligase [Ureaplasma zalophigenitalium]MCV3754332.1 aspartate--ammonia ligase [Ureaplasma zalophigenitalium]
MSTNTRKAIKLVQEQIMFLKNRFQKYFQEDWKMLRVTAPLFVKTSSGFNDELDGVQKPISFQAKNIDLDLQIVHSLAKWKRYALKAYEFNVYEGLYTDMNAIRAHDDVDHLHSIYVDQWDWEMRINPADRHLDYLYSIVQRLYRMLWQIEQDVCALYQLKSQLPQTLFFISAQELEDLYPINTPQEREYLICKKYKAVFISRIGYPLKSQQVHSTRSPSYDDWNLNGDLVVYHAINDEALELSSMGIRVDASTYCLQTKKQDQTTFANEYERLLLTNQLPYCIGGGIGQSRLCMFILQKRHIGEVQVSAWTDEYIELWKKKGVHLL